MNSKQVLTIQHRKEVGPGGVLGLFSVVKEDVHPLMVLLSDKSSKILDECWLCKLVNHDSVKKNVLLAAIKEENLQIFGCKKKIKSNSPKE